MQPAYSETRQKGKLMVEYNIDSYSPGTMVGSAFTYDEDNFFNTGPEEELSLGPDFFLFEDESYTRNACSNETSFFAPSSQTVKWSKFPNISETQIDFTPFLERLDSSTDKQMMQLLARYFHDKTTIFKNDVVIYNIFDDFSSGNQDFKVPQEARETSNENLNSLGTRVIVTLSLEDKRCPQLVRDFVEEADDLLDNREDLKVALRAVFPPTIASSGFVDPIFSSPLARSAGRKRRKAARNNRISATIAALYGNDPNDADSISDKRFKKRGRPRKNTILATEEPFVKEVYRMDSKHDTRDSESKNVSKKKEVIVDDEWKPEKKRVKNTKKAESGEVKKGSKAKSPNDKAKEEADLASMTPDALEKHIVSLQDQMRNVKHKHRKGTICPRCTTEQRLKLATKARNRITSDTKNYATEKNSSNSATTQIIAPAVSVTVTRQAAQKAAVAVKEKKLSEARKSLAEAKALALSKGMTVAHVPPSIPLKSDPKAQVEKN